MLRSGLQLSSIPFLRLLAPLCIGICVRHAGTHLDPFYLGLLVSALLSLLFIYRKLSFFGQPYWGAGLIVTTFCLGFLRSQLLVNSFPVLPSQQYFIILDEYPLEKEKTYQVVGQIAGTENRILAYLSKNNDIKTARPGDLFFFNGLPELIQNEGNPFEFDFCGYLNDKKIGYRIFLKEDQYHLLRGFQKLNISRYALIIRQKLIEDLYRSGIKTESVHLIASISFGDREEVDRETIQSFTNTGVIHVLAVSGMNVGLIFIILNFIFRFLKSGRIGQFLYGLVIMTGIWGYALVTGMSASILRAAMMFTFVLIGNVLRRDSTIYNSLAVSAFLLIAWDPSMIRDAGFQLSYAAVLAIILIQPFIYKQLCFKTRLFDKIWLLLSVTFAAQFGTLPFTLHYFHQFPVYFWLANLVVIPLVTLILYLSFVVVFCFYISTFLTSIFAFVLDWSVRIVLLTVNIVDNLPYAVWKGLTPSIFQTLLIFMMAYLCFRYARLKKTLQLYGILGAAILIFLSIGISTYKQYVRSEIVFFNIPGTRAIALTNGRKVVVLYDRCEQAEEKLMYFIKPYLEGRRTKEFEIHRLSDSLQLKMPSLYATGNFIFFKGTRLFVQPNSEENSRLADPPLNCDLVWMRNRKELKSAHIKFPQSKIILYKASDPIEQEIRQNSSFQSFNVKKSVILTFQPSDYEISEKMICSYFDELD